MLRLIAGSAISRSRHLAALQSAKAGMRANAQYGTIGRTPDQPKAHAMTVMLKRAYAPADASDGMRILVDRLWPRGVSKARAHLDLWLKDVAPSTELRKWFDHDPTKWVEFKRRYRAELKHNPAFAELQQMAGKHDLTLVYAARDQQHNEAVVLQQLLQAHH